MMSTLKLSSSINEIATSTSSANFTNYPSDAPPFNLVADTTNIKLITGVTFGVVIGLLLISCGTCYFMKRRKQKRILQSQQMPVQTTTEHNAAHPIAETREQHPISESSVVVGNSAMEGEPYQEFYSQTATATATAPKPTTTTERDYEFTDYGISVVGRVNPSTGGYYNPKSTKQS